MRACSISSKAALCACSNSWGGAPTASNSNENLAKLAMEACSACAARRKLLVSCVARSRGGRGKCLICAQNSRRSWSVEETWAVSDPKSFMRDSTHHPITSYDDACHDHGIGCSQRAALDANVLDPVEEGITTLSFP